jgi:hypothetical protein
MHWSLVHGLATLLVDGSLGEHSDEVGPGPGKSTEALVEQTLDAFSRAAASLAP